MTYNLGIDVGSTTVKIVLIDNNNKILYKSYDRHLSNVRELTLKKLDEITNIVGNTPVKVSITGSAGLGIATACNLNFVQEVYATTGLIKEFYPDCNVAIELGGEDAKIIFFDGNLEERMNNTCAGGTGAFIDQMAVLLNVTCDEMDKLSLNSTATYPIASRCGVFAKTDIQPLINQGASKENIAASIFQAVVDQTITGLAQGRPIKGNVIFLGGPLSFLFGLQKAFVNTLKNITPIFPENAQYFVGFGAAYYASKTDKCYKLSEIVSILNNENIDKESYEKVNPLFDSEADYKEFVKRHKISSVAKCSDIPGCNQGFLGIDAGSTTTKSVVIDKNSNLIYSSYMSNNGDPLKAVSAQLQEFYTKYPHIKIVSSTVTGYGEELIKNAYNVDFGVVETIAHYTSAKFFEPEVDFIIDIGGQDMKCFGIKNGAIDSITLNEACSSGCGSFLETFAMALGYTADEFAKLAIMAKNPVNLGSRCTVFMNSSVKQAQKSGADISDISAGLAISVVKNAIYKVLRVSDVESLGKKIVVQGGTFLNDCVLRAFEMLTGSQVIRPNIAGLMGAFGAAIIAKDRQNGESRILSLDDLKKFTHSSNFAHCGLCANNCSLTVNKFPNGNKFISGNRCERPTSMGKQASLPNLYDFKQKYLAQFCEHKGSKATIGLPFVLNFYDMMPFWFTFFSHLGFSVLTSKPSTRATYRRGQHTIPSDTICYGAKLVHGHILDLADAKVDFIFYPQSSYNYNEKTGDNYYHCPVVAYYPGVIESNVKDIGNTKLLTPFLDFNDLKFLAKQMQAQFCDLGENIPLTQINEACNIAKKAQETYGKSVIDEGERAIKYAKDNKIETLVLAGRPYHIDPEINHGIDRLISSLGFVILSEDSIPVHKTADRRRILNQWTYHSRMYSAAETVCNMPGTELVQLVSFGCGIDAVTTDEIKEMLEKKGKLYTSIKIDEINNLGAIKIRIRSLKAAMDRRYK